MGGSAPCRHSSYYTTTQTAIPCTWTFAPLTLFNILTFRKHSRQGPSKDPNLLPIKKPPVLPNTISNWQSAYPRNHKLLFLLMFLCTETTAVVRSTRGDIARLAGGGKFTRGDLARGWRGQKEPRRPLKETSKY